MVIGFIYWTAGVEALLFVMLLIWARKCNKMVAAGQEHSSIKWTISMLETGNVVFVTIVSIFPLLGMLGTVMSLLNLDMAGNMEGLKNNFFQALDTTKLGIIFAIGYKFLYALRQIYIEEQITKGKEMRKEYTNKGLQ
ncbi:MAG: MotA/TolQ/ExbB proton channel family protein [Lachnospiraceae bacterium]|nr:MotA/TolQ/ExbB proton channel family protein [Lachnospiraceae bacterium]